MYHLQGQEVKDNFFNIRTHVRSFLLLTSILSGCIIGLLTSNTKMFTETVKMSSSYASTIINPFFYLFGGNMFICMTANFYNLNITMSLYSQLYVLPFYESCSICFNLVSGLMLMGERDLYSKQQLSCIFIGCLISVSGILLKLQTLEAYD